MRMILHRRYTTAVAIALALSNSIGLSAYDVRVIGEMRRVFVAHDIATATCQADNPRPNLLASIFIPMCGSDPHFGTLAANASFPEKKSFDALSSRLTISSSHKPLCTNGHNRDPGETAMNHTPIFCVLKGDVSCRNFRSKPS
jgi:hypothetical protein